MAAQLRRKGGGAAVKWEFGCEQPSGNQEKLPPKRRNTGIRRKTLGEVLIEEVEPRGGEQTDNEQAEYL